MDLLTYSSSIAVTGNKCKCTDNGVSNGVVHVMTVYLIELGRQQLAALCRVSDLSTLLSLLDSGRS
jgi:hypothetical protein